VSKKRGPRFATRSDRDRSGVPYGEPQAVAGSVPVARRGSAGRTVLKVGVGLAMPFVARAIFRALTK